MESVRAGSGADRIGVQPGDLLLGDQRPRARRTPPRCAASVVSLRGETRALIVVQRGNGRYQVAIPLG